jgi:hypothetical protein
VTDRYQCLDESLGFVQPEPRKVREAALREDVVVLGGCSWCSWCS